MTVLVSGLTFGADLPPEVQAFRDRAIADSMKVRISGEKLKADYTVLEAKENLQTATYKVEDMPRKGVQATVTYRINPDDIRNIYRDAGESPRRKDGEEYKEWRAALHEKRINFPKPFPETVVCVEENAGVQTKYRFYKGSLSAYVRHSDELTQATVIWFHDTTNQVSRFYRIQNGDYTGLAYMFDKEGSIVNIVDHGPPPTKRRSSISWDEYTQKLFQDNTMKFVGSKEFLESPEGKAFLETPEGKEVKAYLERTQR